MAGRFLHVVLMPEDGGQIRNYRITARALRGVILGLTALVLALGVSMVFHVRTLREAQALHNLRAENAALRDQLTQFRKHREEIETRVEWVGRREREARLLAGLEPIDEDTRRLGIGGPTEELTPASMVSKELEEGLRDEGLRLDRLTRDLAFQMQSLSEVLTTMEKNRDRLGRTPTICPVRGVYTLSSGFGARSDPFTGRWGHHNGLDFRAAPGTPVLTTADGEVASVGFNGDFGLCVQIDHGDGVETVYCHLASASVRPGQKVRRAERIGSVGNSGRSTGPHLHYEVLTRGQPADPQRFILSLTSIPE